MLNDFLITRRSIIGAVVAAPVVAGLSGTVTGTYGALPKRKRPPNILFFFPDQHRFDWLGGNPSLDVRTPNITALAARGTRFTKAYVASPVCGPSRACLASGREYDRCGVGDNFTVYPSNQTTYYQKLRHAGYAVGACGKLDLSKPAFDNGVDGRNHMEEWGFTDLVNCAGKGDAVFQWDKYKTPFEPYMAYLASKGVADIHAADINSRGGGRAKGATAYADVSPTPLDDDEYEDNWIGRTGLDVLRRFPADAPWHLVVNFAGPHDPEDITKRMESTVRDRSLPPPIESTELDGKTHNAIRQNYTAMVENIDRWVGLYIEELARRGDLENTIIIFASDHGDMLGDHNRWGKNVPYEASVGVPLVVAGPGIKQQASNALISLIDVSATILDFAGGEPPEGMTARSFRPLLEGTTQVHREYVLSGLYNWRMISDGHYKLIEGFSPNLEKNYGSTPKGESRPVVLFDLKQDPLESKNIADAEPETVKRLMALLPQRNPDPDYGFAKPEQIKAYGRKS